MQIALKPQMNNPSQNNFSPDDLPTGFAFGAMVAGIKKSGRLDLAVIAAESDAVAAGVYTQNLVYATSIQWCRERTPSPRIRAVVVNSGNANACTGDEGVKNNRRLAELAAGVVGCEADQVLVLSTGVIGHQLPIAKIEDACGRFPEMKSSAEAFLQAADAITTTDQYRKVASGGFDYQGQRYRVAAMAKGAGMIGPNMATMLGIVLTDFPLTTERAQAAVKAAANRSFNCISVEGHTSTNDALVMLSPHVNKVGADRSETDRGGVDDSAFEVFLACLQDVCLRCAKMIPTDGEGATHLVEIRVQGTQSDNQADRIARSIANSALVKCAFFGNDPNWGRIVSAAGYAGVPFAANEVELRINRHLIFAHGRPEKFSPAEVSGSMKSAFEVLVELQVGSGPGQAIHYTSDLTVDYVKFNSEYTT